MRSLHPDADHSTTTPPTAPQPATTVGRNTQLPTRIHRGRETFKCYHAKKRVVSTNNHPDPNTTSTETDELITYPWTKKLHCVVEDSVTACGQSTDNKEVIHAQNPLEAIYSHTTPAVKPCKDCFTSDYHQLHQLYLKGHTAIQVTTPEEELISSLPWSIDPSTN